MPRIGRIDAGHDDGVVGGPLEPGQVAQGVENRVLMPQGLRLDPHDHLVPLGQLHGEMKLIRVLVVGHGDIVQLQEVAHVGQRGSMARRIPAVVHGLADEFTLTDGLSLELLEDELLTLDRAIVGKLLLALPEGGVLAGRSKGRIRTGLAGAQVVGGGGHASFKNLLEWGLPGTLIRIAIGWTHGRARLSTEDKVSPSGWMIGAAHVVAHFGTMKSHAGYQVN